MLYIIFDQIIGKTQEMLLIISHCGTILIDKDIPHSILANFRSGYKFGKATSIFCIFVWIELFAALFPRVPGYWWLAIL